MRSFSFLSKNYGEAGRLGAGSFGAVVRVYDEDTGGEFAAKCFDSSEDAEMPSDALRELSFMSLLTLHDAPRLVPLHDFSFELSGQRGLVAYMPLYRRDLGSAIDEADLRVSARLRVARDLLEALRFLHGSCPAIVHRDVKPENVLLDGEDRAFLTDFSFMRFVEKEEGQGVPPDERGRVDGGVGGARGGWRPPSEVAGRCAAAATSSCGSGVLGTPTYIAPEVFQAARPAPPIDCWGAGVVLLELFQNSRLPTDRDKAALRLVRKARDSMVDKPVPCLVKGLLAEDPAERLSARRALQDASVFPGAEASADVGSRLVFCAAPQGGEGVAGGGRGRAFPPSKALLSACRALEQRNEQTLVAARHFSEVLRTADVRLLCVIACKMYEHDPLPDNDLLEAVGGGFSEDDLAEVQEELLTLMKGCLLVPPRTGAGPPP